MAQRMPVASLADVLTTKLLALTEQEPDFSSRPRARALAAGADRLGPRPRAHDADSPFARAFFTLVEELGVVDEPAAQTGGRLESRPI